MPVNGPPPRRTSEIPTPAKPPPKIVGRSEVTGRTIEIELLPGGGIELREYRTANLGGRFEQSSILVGLNDLRGIVAAVEELLALVGKEQPD